MKVSAAFVPTVGVIKKVQEYLSMRDLFSFRTTGKSESPPRSRFTTLILLRFWQSQNQTSSSFLFWGLPSIPSQEWEAECALPGHTPGVG